MLEGDNAGDVLPGQKPIDAALRELKTMAGVVASAAAAGSTGKPEPKTQ